MLIASDNAVSAPASAAKRARSVQCGETRADNEDEQRDLRCVMIDAARLELSEHRSRQKSERDCENAARADEQSAAPGEPGIKAALQHRWKGNARETLRCFRIREQAKDADQQDKRHIDDARPMDEKTLRWIDAMDDHVEPALARHEIAHLNHAHRVIAVEKGAALPDREEARPSQSEPEHERSRNRQRHRRQRRGFRTHAKLARRSRSDCQPMLLA
jgi:hypothetical protein